MPQNIFRVVNNWRMFRVLTSQGYRVSLFSTTDNSWKFLNICSTTVNFFLFQRHCFSFRLHQLLLCIKGSLWVKLFEGYGFFFIQLDEVKLETKIFLLLKDLHWVFHCHFGNVSRFIRLQLSFFIIFGDRFLLSTGLPESSSCLQIFDIFFCSFGVALFGNFSWNTLLLQNFSFASL